MKIEKLKDILDFWKIFDEFFGKLFNLLFCANLFEEGFGREVGWMRRKGLAVFLAGLFAFLSACASGYSFYGPFGSIYTQTLLPVSGNKVGGSKRGESCATSILGLIAIGDASVETAARNAGITKIYNVTVRNMSILGIYSQFCTVVRGE